MSRSASESKQSRVLNRLKTCSTGDRDSVSVAALSLRPTTSSSCILQVRRALCTVIAKRRAQEANCNPKPLRSAPPFGSQSHLKSHLTDCSRQSAQQLLLEIRPPSIGPSEAHHDLSYSVLSRSRRESPLDRNWLRNCWDRGGRRWLLLRQRAGPSSRPNRFRSHCSAILDSRRHRGSDCRLLRSCRGWHESVRIRQRWPSIEGENALHLFSGPQRKPARESRSPSCKTQSEPLRIAADFGSCKLSSPLAYNLYGKRQSLGIGFA
jgi:hypothetical protein